MGHSPPSLQPSPHPSPAPQYLGLQRGPVLRPLPGPSWDRMAQASRLADPLSGRGRQGVQLCPGRSISEQGDPHPVIRGTRPRRPPPARRALQAHPAWCPAGAGTQRGLPARAPLRTQARGCRLLSGIPLGRLLPSHSGASLGALAAGLSRYQLVSSAWGPQDCEAAAPSRRVNVSRYWPDRSSPAASSSLAPARQPLLPGHTFHPFNHLYCLALDPVPGPHPLRGVLT